MLIRYLFLALALALSPVAVAQPQTATASSQVAIEWGPEIPLDVGGKPDWLPEYLPIVRIARSALVPPDSWFPAGLSRGEWAATRAIQLPAASDLYKRPEVRALIDGVTAPVAQTTAAPDSVAATLADHERRIRALESRAD